MTLLAENRHARVKYHVIETVEAGKHYRLFVTLAKVPDDPKQRTVRHPRTAVGTRADGSVVWLVVDGRHPQARGMTFEELGAVFRGLGCERAVNLRLCVSGNSFSANTSRFSSSASS